MSSQAQQGGVQTQVKDSDKPKIGYSCADCGESNEIRPREPIRCKECGCRVMYKNRVERVVQFEAR